jgi:DNA-binding response OmpR family regulator
MKNAGKVMTRKKLMRLVWQTDYIGDTRTLDVHISWLRKAIEEDPAQPGLLKTVRGKGYRLDLPPEK